MKPYYALKTQLKVLRWQARRLNAMRMWGPAALSAVPPVLGNAMPKSGSHLIIQVLQGLTRIGPFINPGFPPVNRAEDNSNLSDAATLRNILRMRSGDIAYGYVQARQPFLAALKQAERATVFVYRDPRDMIVSHVFYATQIHTGHDMHHYYTEKLNTMEERINAAIVGVQEEGARLSGVRTKYMDYIAWLEQPEVLSLRFEDLILQREETLGKLLDYVCEKGFSLKIGRAQAIAALAAAIAPRKSGTFRKGQPGNWREHFTGANLQLFQEEAGDLLGRLGYEENPTW